MSQSEQLIRTITEGTSAVTGADFFRSLVQHLAEALHLRYAFVAECLPDKRAKALAFWQDGKLGDNFEYDLKGTPCFNVAAGEACLYPDRLQQLFPRDAGLVALQAESYHGVPVMDSTRGIVGHLVVMDDCPMQEDPLRLAALETFAARAGVELERVRAYDDVNRLNLELAAILEINRAIGRHLDRDELFAALAACLKTLVPTDWFGIEMPMKGEKLQGHILNLIRGGAEPITPTVLPAQGTACNWVMEHHEWVISDSSGELRERFPVTFDVMSDMGMESLLALPLVSGGQSRAALFFMAAAKGAYGRLRRGLLEQLAGAVAVALDNCLAHEELRRQGTQALAESEERFRDLFEEAPIAYVNEGLDSKFIRANRTAMKTLGIMPDQVDGTYGSSFIPNTPDAQRRLKEAFDSIGKGIDTSGVVLELRRRDNGNPLWIKWWSRPDPSGTYTRTMFVDITEQVLAEQEKARLEAENVYLQEEIKTEHNFEEMIGQSEGLRRVLRTIEQVAPTDATILLLGETGTGKELLARAIHNISPRKDRTLVKVNCGAISAGLVESELFGHEKGAFTGALQRRVGRFELADGGTIFLDEVGELPQETQIKLLRVLQEGEFERVGSSKSVKVDARIIAATNRDLDAAVKDGSFRRDLFYRLNVVPLEVPPLRERKSDISLLANFFLMKSAKKLNKRIKGISPETMTRLIGYHWPGNIRELQNVIERAVVIAEGEEIRIDPSLLRPSSSQIQAPESLESMERAHIVRVLEQTDWVIEGKSGAASILEINPNTLRSRMQKLGIKKHK